MHASMAKANVVALRTVTMGTSSSGSKTGHKLRMGRNPTTAFRASSRMQDPAVRSVRVMAASQNPDKPQGRAEEGTIPGTRTLTPDEQDRMDRGVGAVGLSKEGAGCGGQWISSTTRHVHIFAGEIVNGDLDQSQLDKLTIDVDPDSEFNWNDSALNKVFAKFDEVVEQHAGAPLNDYTLRLIGSDVEHFIRKLLQKGEISYDLEHRALNYSMGRPRLPIEGVEDVKEASAEAAPVTEESPATVKTSATVETA